MDVLVKVRFQGRVQGVGFRWTVAGIAARRPVTGYVRNEPDGSVRLVAEGLERDLADFLGEIDDSHVGRHIRNRTADWRPALGEFTEFGIKY